MSDRSEDQEWMLMISEAFANGNDEFLAEEFGWDEEEVEM